MEINLGEKTFQARVTLDSIMRIESKLKKGVIKIATDMQNGDITFQEIVTILTPVIRSGGNNIKEDEIGSAIFEAGMTEGIRCVAEVLATVLNAGQDEGNEMEAEA